MVKLVYSAKLTADAQRAVNRCRFEHTSAGENLYLYTSWNMHGKTAEQLIEMAINSWAGEKTNRRDNYRYRGYSSASRASGHYNQIIWADSTAVGCAHKRCYNRDLVTCRYYPYGNFRDQFPYEAGSRGSNCPEGKTCV